MLADLDNPSHVEDLERHGITPIGLIVSNLYPFVERPDVETIDIGGPAMVRAAAKNHAHVAVVVDPSDYDAVLDELRRDGAISLATRRQFARKAFAHTSAYDAAISAWLDGDERRCAAVDAVARRSTGCRSCATARTRTSRERGTASVALTSWWDDAVQHGGKELSYLNLFDAEAAWRLVHQLGDRPAAVVVKHANPCGVAIADDITEAYVAAHECDPVSAFGGIVALNRPVPDSLAQALAPVFTEVVVAPSYDDGALATLTAKKNLRVLSAPPPGAARPRLPVDRRRPARAAGRHGLARPRRLARRHEGRADRGAVARPRARLDRVRRGLVERDRARRQRARRRHRRGPAEPRRLGPDRGDACGRTRAKGGACASDAFFPFRDGLDAAADAGVAAVIQPGGSVRDDEVIAAADEHGLAMVFTGERHFRH